MAETSPSYPELNQSADPEQIRESFDPLHTESKFTLARDAVQKQKPHAVSSTHSYLSIVIRLLCEAPTVPKKDGIFDVRVLATIDQSAHTITELRYFFEIMAASPEADSYIETLTEFLQELIQIKARNRLPSHHAYLWRDSMRFILREIFVSMVAAFLAQERWSVVAALMRHEYRIENTDRSLSYTSFDGFLRSIDVFRNRRLKLQRVSITADLLQDRIGECEMLFEDIMQADFVLHLYSRLNHRKNSQHWVARTLCHADEQSVNGFKLFVLTRGNEHQDCLRVLFGVENWSQLMDRVHQFGAADELSENPQLLNYAGFLASGNALFNH